MRVRCRGTFAYSTIGAGLSKIVHRPLPQDAPARRKPVIALAKKELGWEPRTSLDDGFQKTIRYFGAVLREA